MFETRIITLCTLIANLKANAKYKLLAQYDTTLAGYQKGRSNRTTIRDEINSVVSVARITISSVVLYLNIFHEKHSKLTCTLKFKKHHAEFIRWIKCHLTTYN